MFLLRTNLKSKPFRIIANKSATGHLNLCFNVKNKINPIFCGQGIQMFADFHIPKTLGDKGIKLNDMLEGSLGKKNALSEKYSPHFIQNANLMVKINCLYMQINS